MHSEPHGVMISFLRFALAKKKVSLVSTFTDSEEERDGAISLRIIPVSEFTEVQHESCKQLTGNHLKWVDLSLDWCISAFWWEYDAEYHQPFTLKPHWVL